MTCVVFAPDSFKGTIGAADAASALAEGWRSVDPTVDVVLCPMADGGEGTLDALTRAIDGSHRIPVEVGPPAQGRARVRASWLLLPAIGGGRTAVVELASTAGIELYGDELDPWGASTHGFGEAIVAALDAGATRLVLAIGSSASTDGGAGLLAAMGARFTGVDKGARLSARHLPALEAVDLRGLRPLPSGGAIVLTDVTSPLLGPHGAAAVFGPQKGLSASDVGLAERGLDRLSALLPADPDRPGAGAAGGAGFGLSAWGATLASGAEAIAELLGLRAALADADLLVTGEGRYDAQSAGGKVPAYVAGMARQAGVDTALVAGRVDDDADTSCFVRSVSLVSLAGSTALAIGDPRRWLRAAGAELAALW